MRDCFALLNKLAVNEYVFSLFLFSEAERSKFNIFSQHVYVLFADLVNQTLQCKSDAKWICFLAVVSYLTTN